MTDQNVGGLGDLKKPGGGTSTIKPGNSGARAM